MRRRHVVLLSFLLLAVSCSTGGDDHGAGGDPGGGGGTAPPAAAEPAAVVAATGDASDLAGGQVDQVNELVATDDLAPTAVGSTTRADGTGTLPVVWELGADEAWARVDLPLGEASEAFLDDVAGFAGGALAVGGRRIDGAFQASTWRRGDGGWELVGPISDEDGVSSVVAVAAHDGTAVAVGSVDPPGGETPASRNRAWASTDGTTWTSVDHPSFRAEGTELTDVAAGPGGIVIVGRTDDGTTSAPRAWWSTDGQTWDPVGVPGGAGSALGHVVALGDGFVAGGSVTSGATSRPATWASPDGRSWERPTTDLPVRETGRASDGGTSVVSLTSRGGVVSATNGLSFTPEVWRSTDGLRWTSWGGSLGEVEGYEAAEAPADVALDGAGQPIVLVAEGPNLLVPRGGTWVEASGTADALTLDTERTELTAASAGDDGELFVLGAAHQPKRPGERRPVPVVSWRTRATGGWNRDEPEQLVDHAIEAAIDTDVGLVAVGFRILIGDDTDDALVAVRSGGDWQPIGGVDDLAARALLDVDRWRGGWLAVGVDLQPDSSRPAGTASRRVVVQGAGPDSPPVTAPLGGLAADPAGDQTLGGLCTSEQGAVIVGSDIGGTSGTRPLVAHSADPSGGWTVATADDDFGQGRPGVTVDDCTAGAGGRYLLHGGVTAGDGQPEPLAWLSDDGLTWERIRSDAWGGPGGQEVIGAVAVDGGWIVVGDEGPEGAGDDVAAWFVTDDGAVSRLPLAGDLVGDGGQNALAVVDRDDEIVVVGDDDGAPAIWALPTAELIAAA